jgi:hypothetical protein
MWAMTRFNRVCAVVAFALVSGEAMGQLNSQPPVAACGPEKIDLTYPTEAAEQYITGVIEAKVKVNLSGSATNIRLNGIRAFAPVVRRGLKKAAFATGCRNTSTTLRFEFHLDRTLPLDTPTSVRRVSPSVYNVTAPTNLTGSWDVDPEFIFEGNSGLFTRIGRFFSRLLGHHE